MFIYIYVFHPNQRRQTGEVLDVCYSLNEKLFATASADGTALVYDAHTFELLHELKGHRDEISKVCNFKKDSIQLSRNVIIDSVTGLHR
jgi:WD40 repeat protein